MFIKQKEVNIKMKRYLTMDIFMGFLAMQNPYVFDVKKEYLKYHKICKEKYGDLLQSIIPYEDLDHAEILLNPLLELVIKHGELVKNQNNHLIESTKINGLLKLINHVYELKPEYWKDDEKNDINITHISEVIDLLEKRYGYQLSLEHKKMVEDSNQIIIIPSRYMGVQLGFNSVLNHLILLVGAEEKVDEILIDNDVYVKCMAALGDKRRMKIMQKLLFQQQSIEGIELAKILGITAATVSHHLNVLRQAGLVSRAQSGKVVSYTPERARLKKMIDFLQLLTKE